MMQPLQAATGRGHNPGLPDGLRSFAPRLRRRPVGQRRLTLGRWLGAPIGLLLSAVGLSAVGLSAISLTTPDFARAITLPSSSRRAKPASLLPSQPASRPQPPSALHTTCPTDLEPLTQKLLQDLPSYANRYIIRQTRRADFATMSQVVAASAPDLTPLPLSTGGSAATPPDPTLKQVFFTTLERQTTGKQLFELQQHHWLFLTPTPNHGWRLAMLYTRLGSYPAGRVITPPRESSQGPIGQAVALWLRDCQAGAIVPTRSGPPLAK
jgi:hypothetical protein